MGCGHEKNLSLFLTFKWFQGNKQTISSFKRSNISHLRGRNYDSALAKMFTRRFPSQCTVSPPRGLPTQRPSRLITLRTSSFCSNARMQGKISPGLNYSFLVWKDTRKISLSWSSLQNLNLINVVLSISSQNENKHREFKLAPFCRAVVSIANLIGTSPSRVETIRAWLKPAHSFYRGVIKMTFHAAHAWKRRIWETSKDVRETSN